jgi:uncharacterized protein YraI
MKKIVTISIVLLFVLSGCGLLLPGTPTVDPVAQAIAQTAAVQSAASTLMAQAQPVTPPTEAPIPTAIPIVEVQPTAVPPTAVPSVQATATKNANCRSGPAANFDYIGVLNQGETANVIGHNLEFGKWWQVILADGKQCWVIEDAVSLSGDLNTVAMVASPSTPTPIPAPNWTGNWTLFIDGSFTPGEAPQSASTTMTQSGNEVKFNFAGFGSNFFCTGVVSADGMTVQGNMGSDWGGGWTFRLVRVEGNLNQFRGKWFVNGADRMDGGMCGFKSGAGMPSPCRP